MGKHAPEEVENALGPELDEALLALDELAAEDPEEALTMFDTLPEPVQALAHFQLVLARAHQNLEQLEAARDLVEKVLARDADNADAHHLLGDVLEDMGETAAANDHFLRTLSLDEKAYASLPADERIEGDEVESVLGESLEKLLDKRSIQLEVRNFPDASDVKSGIDPRALFVMPDDSRLVAYLSNIQAELGDLDEDDFIDALTFAAASEIADSLDLDEEELAEAGVNLSEPEA